MSSHDITIFGYVLIALAVVAVDLRGRRGTGDLRSFDEVLRWVLQTRSGRIGLFSAWAWIGLHFLG